MSVTSLETCKKRIAVINDYIKKHQCTNIEALGALGFTKFTYYSWVHKVKENEGLEFLPEITCPICFKIFKAKSGNHTYCSKECRQIFYDTKKRKIGRFVIFERDMFICIYCGSSSIIDGVKLHVDHIIPKSKGGLDEAGNLITSCNQCNLEKFNNELRPVNLKQIKEIVHQRNFDSNINPKLTIKFTM